MSKIPSADRGSLNFWLARGAAPRRVPFPFGNKDRHPQATDYIENSQGPGKNPVRIYCGSQFTIEPYFENHCSVFSTAARSLCA